MQRRSLKPARVPTTDIVIHEKGVGWKEIKVLLFFFFHYYDPGVVVDLYTVTVIVYGI